LLVAMAWHTTSPAAKEFTAPRAIVKKTASFRNPVMSFDICNSVSSQNFSLQGFLDHVPDLPVRQALELMHLHLRDSNPSVLDDIFRSYSHVMSEIPIAGLDLDLKLALYIYLEEEMQLQHGISVRRELNKAFFELRSPHSLQPYAAYAKILLRAVLEVMKQPQHSYEGPAYRASAIVPGTELYDKYTNFSTNFVVGSFLTFPSFVSVTSSDKKMHDFAAQHLSGYDKLMLNFTRLRGMRPGAISPFPFEEEIIVPPPSIFRILTTLKIDGGLVLTLESVDSPLVYLNAAPLALAATHSSPVASIQQLQSAPHSFGQTAHHTSPYPGLQVCDISDLIFDSATEPKEGGYGSAAWRAAPQNVFCAPAHFKNSHALYQCALMPNDICLILLQALCCGCS
jgi:hypothetical protein